MARLKEQYKAEVAPALMKQFGYKSVMQIPKIDKVVINVGCGEARENAKVLDNVVGDLGKITGQKAVITRARKSIANFKLRANLQHLADHGGDESAFNHEHKVHKKQENADEVDKVRIICHEIGASLIAMELQAA